ncbi:transporter [uncultured Metabacillus sp.]|uniref:transporter n=1 Tax=uncultured Metabacillus sp. TaxID=2860135 RepID=UPI002632C745|nr:transporter [uncultured Metabacillus sp.]
MYPYYRQLPIQIPGFPQLGGGTGFPPFGPPGSGFGGGPGQSGPPSGPPPTVIPPEQGQGQFGVYAVDPGGIRGCLYRYTYVRLNNGRAFWYYPTFVGRNSVAGWRWRRNQYRWVYFGIDLDRIRSFSCY